ncbi:hypothetical protein Tco_1015872 [Tanacetum coccineum]|uniref:Zinc knuckle CX2CX4HX4C n=1 Tax=Tanacetum coccineum TaxID=301880 RepID=A0ABQ5FNX0_9ASTR
MCLQSWGKSSYARAMIKLRADVELKDTIVMAMPKLSGEGFYTCIIRVEYEWPRCACCKVFAHIQEECPKNLAKKYRHVPKKPTANTSGNKKKGVEPTKEVSNLNLFDVLNSVDNDGKPLKKVDYPSDHDSKDEVESVDNDMARSMASKRVGFGTKSLLEQWRDSYENDDYDEYPYDDDMYKGQDLPNKVQDICDNLDIRVRCRRKK